MIHLYFGYLFNLYIKKQYIYIYIYILHKNQLFYNQQWETERPTQKSIINVTPKAKKEVNVIATSSLSYTHAYTHQKTHIGIETGGTPLPQYPNLISLTLTQALLHVHTLKHTDRITQRKKKKNEKPIIIISRKSYRYRKRRRWWWEFWQVDTVLQQSGAEERAVDAGGGWASFQLHQERRWRAVANAAEASWATSLW